MEPFPPPPTCLPAPPRQLPEPRHGPSGRDADHELVLALECENAALRRLVEREHGTQRLAAVEAAARFDHWLSRRPSPGSTLEALVAQSAGLVHGLQLSCRFHRCT